MNPGQLEAVYAGLIVVVLIGLAGYFGRRQWQLLRSLPWQEGLSRDDRRYEYGKIWRRLTICGLMAVLAVLLSAFYLLGLNDQALALAEQGRTAQAGGQSPVMSPEQRHSVNVLSVYWIVLTLGVLAIFCLAGADLLAIRRYGLRQYRQIQADRRAMLAEQAARLRRERQDRNFENN